MTKFCVKKPYFIVVAVIIVLVIGGVSLSNMQTNLLPDMEIPYLLVITTEPGASPEKVESDVTKTVESALGTINGVEDITSYSSENYGMTMLEFGDDTNMDSALVRVSQAVDSLELPDGCGTPNIMEVSMDMVATMYAGIEYEGKDIKEITEFTNQTLIPYLERQNGVASISDSGAVEDSVEIRLNEDKIDEINDEILYETNKKLKKAQKKIDQAQSQIDEAESTLREQSDALSDKESDTYDSLGDASVQLPQAQATKAAYQASLNSLKASRAALKAEKKAYNDGGIKKSYNQLNSALAGFKENMSYMESSYDITIPGSVEEAINNPEDFEKFVELLGQSGAVSEDELESMTVENLEQLYNIVEVRIPQINTELANLKVEIAAAKTMVATIEEQLANIDETQSNSVSGGYQAVSGFSSAQIQISSGEDEIETAKDELEESQEQLDTARQAAIENSNLDTLLSMDTLSSLIEAQNFSMPAGYVEDEDNHQWIVKIGEEYTDADQLKDMVLTKTDGVGTIKLSDVADVTVVDNSGDSYAKMNGEDAIMLSIFKSSTSNTSEVSENLKDAFSQLEDKYEGLKVTPLIDQADYISVMIKSILTSILLGALLAIIILALFLRDVKPTLIVAFSIPFSVLFAIIIMYFTDLTLNIMTLAGLCLGIGMLVDNSIVVVENIYRLRSRGIAPARAAVQGARQVAAPIIASTLTTICVFLPMVFVSGTVSQLIIPFAFTISYALIASLIVALTIVPTMGAAALKNVKPKEHKWFDKVKDVYEKALTFSLNHKQVPIIITVALLIFCIWQVSRMGMVIMSDTASEQVMITLTLDEDTEKDKAYETADAVLEAVAKVDGVDKVGAMDGNASTSTGSVVSTTNNYTEFMFFIIPDDDVTTVRDSEKLTRALENATKEIECEELTVSSSAMGDMSSIMSSGLEVNIYGSDQQQLISISEDVMGMMESIEGCENVTNGIGENDRQIHLKIKKNKAAKYGLTVATIYQQIYSYLTTEDTATTITMDETDIDVNIVDETDTLTYENIMDADITATSYNSDGEEKEKTYKLSKFATMEIEESAATLTRSNQSEYLSVTAETGENYNTTLLSGKLEKLIDDYGTPEGYTIEIEGESEEVNSMMSQLILAIALGALLIYLVMVAQFQSLLSPFIIIFTIPLAFTGGLIGLLIFDEPISAMAMMGFMILMGTVVNNGIVFVDYVNQLRIQGMDKRTALIMTGRERMRPILMTALTTVCSMSVMVFSRDVGNAMQKPMAVVVFFGLIYATFTTLFIVPVMYDIFYRRQPKVVDVGEDNLDDIPNEAEALLAEMSDGKEV